ncbi:MAG: signal peptidase II [Candidatus Eisenbacteria bacterium]|nr:signal peptidase II [Candidatus Eisenbacteria bacterium]
MTDGAEGQVQPPAPRSRLVVFALIALGVIGLDHLTKWLVIQKLPFNHDIQLIGEWVMLTHIKNTGGAFGLFPGSTVPLIIVSSVASVILCFLAVRLRADWTRLIALGLILGGAVGNLIDRITQKKVTDFINVGLPDGLRWPIFNVADSAVTIGVVVLGYLVYVKGSGNDHAPDGSTG